MTVSVSMSMSASASASATAVGHVAVRSPPSVARAGVGLRDASSQR